MTTRLDRLLLLLSTGSTPLVRQTAAQQLGAIAGQRIQRGHSNSASTSTTTYHGLDGEWAEVVNLLVKVLPYTRSKVWETRAAAALAVECIVKAAGVWEPPDLPSLNYESAEDAQVKTHPLSTFDLTRIVLEGAKLLASSGNEFVKAEGGASMARSDVVKSLGLSIPGAGEQELGIDVEKELQDGESEQIHEVKPDIKGKGRMISEAAPTEEDEMKGLSARERNALKRKRKQSGAGSGTVSSANSSPAPPSALDPPNSKVRIVSRTASPLTEGEGKPLAVPVKKEDSLDDEGLAEQQVTIAYRGRKGGGQIEAKTEDGEDNGSSENKWLPTPDRWPFTILVEALQQDLLNSAWEVRHGSALALREILKVQGRSGGVVAGFSASSIQAMHQEWCESMSVTILQVFALDRFGDFVGDQVVAPVRETVSQTLSALLLYMPVASAQRVTKILLEMVTQEEVKKVLSAQAESGRKTYFWEVKHAGLLGLKYLVAVRRELFEGTATDGFASNGTSVKTEDTLAIPTQGSLLEDVLRAVIEGLRDPDDDVRGVAASALLPIAPTIVSHLPQSQVLELLDVLCMCLGDLKDDLSSSVANVMDLLAALIQYPQVLQLLQQQDSGGGRSLKDLVPSLYPFFRHTISSVRLAVVSALNIFLALPDAGSWIDDKLMRLLYQNLIVEERLETRTSTMQAWSAALEHLSSSSSVPDPSSETLRSLIQPYIIGWLDLLMTPIGQPLDTAHFWRATASSAAYNVDKPILEQDLALVTVEQVLKGRLAGAGALADLLCHWPIHAHENDFGELLSSYLTSASSHQVSFTCIIIEDWAHRSTASNAFTAATSSPIIARLGPMIRKALESDPAIAYSETSALLSQIFTHCTQLFGIFKSKGKVPANSVPPLPSHDFTLARAQHIISADFAYLESQVKSKIARANALPLLQELRNKISVEVVRCNNLKEAMDVQVFAALAGATIALKNLPAKMNPLIRSLMNGLKFEINLDLQTRSARSIAAFVDLCTSSPLAIKTNPTDKIIRNLCTFLCQDTSITPVFSAHKAATHGILSTDSANGSAMNANGAGKKGSKGAGPANGATVHPENTHEIENEAVAKAKLVRRGAEIAIGALSERFKEDAFVRLPVLWICMAETLQASYASGSPAACDTRCLSMDTAGQELLDCLTVLSAVTPMLPSSLQLQIEQLFPHLVLAIQSDFAVIRHVAAKCLAVLCDTLVVEGMRRMVMDVIPFLADPLSISRRRGAVELVSRLIERMDVKILPYVIFLVVPVLGRMTDADDDVRMLATSTFATLVKLVPLEAGLPDPPGFSAELLAKRTHERDFLTQLLDGSKVQQYEPPISVSVDLRKYQKEGVSWLAFLAKYQLHGILCDDMGLGKTLQSICILASKTYERAERFKTTKSPDAVHLPSLVVCPPTLTGHWQQEIQTYVSNLRSTVYTGDRSERLRRVNDLQRFDVVITSYDVVRNDIEALRKLEWNYCILDEGHVIKNGKTKLSQAIKTIRANHRLILSGTPIQNNVLELWSLFDFLMPGFLGTEETFNRRYGKPIQASRDAKSSSKEQEAGALALEALHKQVLPFLLRRLKEDVLDDLPPKIIQDYYCDLSPLQVDLYESYSAGSEDTADGEAVAAEETDAKAGKGKDTHVFQALQYLRKLVNHPTLVLDQQSLKHQKILAKHTQARSAGPELDKELRGIEHAPKLAALKQLLLDSGIGVDSTQGSNGRGVKKEEAANLDDIAGEAVAPHRVLIFCQMKAMLDLIEHTLFREHLPSVTYMRMDGSTPTSKRHAVVQTFNADPSIDVLLLTTSVGGLGLNLTGADTVIFVEHDWNPMKDLQAMDRAHRLGQKRVVNVYRLITRGTLEEKIMGLQRFKLNIASQVVNQQNAGLETMETENVLDLFSLGSGESDDGKKQRKDGPISQKELLQGLQDLDEDGESGGDYRDLNGDIAKFAEQLKG